VEHVHVHSGGAGHSGAIDAVVDCKNVWLIPKGEEPFSLPSYYPSSGGLFDNALVRKFYEKFAIVVGYPRFDVWSCR
jgi:hypothetical protein